MKKKTIFLLSLLAFVESFFAHEINYSPLYIHDEFSKCHGYGLFELMYDDYFIKANNYDGKEFAVNSDLLITKCKIREDKGFKYVEHKNYSNASVFNMYWIFGNGIIIRNIKNREKPITKVVLSENDKKRRESFLITKNNSLKGKYNTWDFNVYIDDGIKKITASSELKEGDVLYKASNLKNRVYTLGGEDWMNYCLDYVTPPWVEGKKGYGIGEYLDIEFYKNVNEIQILNGYVDFDRQYLFKENSRVKTILIESADKKFSQLYELKDLVEFSDIMFPYPTSKIRITIKEVYPGDKYDDTCLTAIIAMNPDKQSFEKGKINAINIMKANKTWDTLQYMIENNVEVLIH